MRRTLLIAGLLLVAAGLMMLAYTLWPLPVAETTGSVPATLFAPPP